MALNNPLTLINLTVFGVGIDVRIWRSLMDESVSHSRYVSIRVTWAVGCWVATFRAGSK